MRTIMEGNQAVAYAMHQIDPHVVAAYPITPQTEIVQEFSNYVANGKVRTQFVAVESEHSAMAACIGAATAGGRVMTATCSQGLALMWELLYVAASLRLPIVMPVVNRALSGNINIHCDHSDSMGARDSGWLQIYAENVQEAYDNTIQAVRIAEQTMLPVMCGVDGFVLSHCLEVLETLEDQAVREFVGEYWHPRPLLDTSHPITIGPLDGTEWYFEHKRSEAAAIVPAKQVIQEVGEEFGRLSGRHYGLLEPYRLDESEYAVLVLGSAAGTAKDVVDERNADVGLIKLRMFRPFPLQEIAALARDLKGIAVLDRAISLGAFAGPVALEVRNALHRASIAVPVINYVYGLGGRVFSAELMHQVCDELPGLAREPDDLSDVRYLGVREGKEAAVWQA